MVTVDGVNPLLSLKSLLFSSKDIKFNSIKLISYEMPSEIPLHVRFHKIAKLSWLAYNRFILHQLYKYVDTEFCLLIQPDGFVLNADKWNDKFFNYDYIGAPWKPTTPHDRVGNGGFSLRSRKLLEFTRHLIYNGINEDGIIAFNKDKLIESGMKYADIDTAYEFSVEDEIPEKEWRRDNCFGFHRYYNYNNFEERSILENFKI